VLEPPTRQNRQVRTTSDDVLEVPWDDPRAVGLRDAMDTEMSGRYADRAAYDGPDGPIGRALRVDPADIAATVLITDGGAAVAHGALRRLGDDWEIKRVIVDTDARGRGVGRRLMAALERIAAERGATRVILQTGDRQPDAVALYRRLGYAEIPTYSPYHAIPFSLCFAKDLQGTAGATAAGVSAAAD
jgi:GNAT superfamily N-acetyltransferase